MCGCHAFVCLSQSAEDRNGTCLKTVLVGDTESVLVHVISARARGAAEWVHVVIRPQQETPPTILTCRLRRSQLFPSKSSKLVLNPVELPLNYCSKLEMECLRVFQASICFKQAVIVKFNMRLN